MRIIVKVRHTGEAPQVLDSPPLSDRAAAIRYINQTAYVLQTMHSRTVKWIEDELHVYDKSGNEVSVFWPCEILE